MQGIIYIIYGHATDEGGEMAKVEICGKPSNKKICPVMFSLFVRGRNTDVRFMMSGLVPFFLDRVLTDARVCAGRATYTPTNTYTKHSD